MELFILRHGRAGQHGDYEDDRARPLTDEGRERSVVSGRGLRRLRVTPQVVLSSPLVRARETAELVAAELEGSPAVELTEVLSPGVGPEAVVRYLRKHHGGAEAALLVGHEPDLSVLIGALVSRDGTARVRMKKGGLCHLRLREGELAELAALYPPGVLIELGAG
jgi:phosphohistidine phosphatase